MGTHGSIRFVLAAILLIAGLPIARQHSHAGGEMAHSHAHGHHHHDEGPLQAHVHASLFGYEVSLPTPDGEDPVDDQTLCLVVGPAVAPTAQAATFVDWSLPNILCVERATPAVPSFGCITAEAAPLCDSARRERSGVLLV